MVYLSSEESRAVTECNHCNTSILAFPQILMALLETHSTALQETEKCLHPDHSKWVYGVQPGSCPRPTVWLSQLRSTGIQCSQIPCTSPSSPLSCLRAFSCLFLAHRQVQHLRLSSAHLWGLLSRNLLSLMELFAFHGRCFVLVALLVCSANGLSSSFLTETRSQTQVALHAQNIKCRM